MAKNPHLHVDLPSESACLNLASRIAEHIQVGDTFALNGELGVGKTTFVKGLVDALEGDVTSVQSPTYTLMHVYEAKMPIIHIDAYRLENNAALEALGYSEYADEGILCVEWANRLDSLTSNKHLWTLNFRHTEEKMRAVEITTPSHRQIAGLS